MDDRLEHQSPIGLIGTTDAIGRRQQRGEATPNLLDHIVRPRACLPHLVRCRLTLCGSVC
jgi:hypothetical protein